MTYDLRVSMMALNPDLLTEQLVAALPERCFGISTYPGNVISVWLADDHTAQEDATAEQVCFSHNPNQLTAAQQAAIAQEQAAITLKSELVQVAERLQAFRAESLDDVNVLAGDLAVLVQAIIGFY